MAAGTPQRASIYKREIPGAVHQPSAPFSKRQRHSRVLHISRSPTLSKFVWGGGPPLRPLRRLAKRLEWTPLDVRRRASKRLSTGRPLGAECARAPARRAVRYSTTRAGHSTHRSSAAGRVGLLTLESAACSLSSALHYYSSCAHRTLYEYCTVLYTIQYSLTPSGRVKASPEVAENDCNDNAPFCRMFTPKISGSEKKSVLSRARTTSKLLSPVDTSAFKCILRSVLVNAISPHASSSYWRIVLLMLSLRLQSNRRSLGTTAADNLLFH